MKKRNLCAELIEGFETLASEREGKVMLETNTVEVKPTSAAKTEKVAEPPPSKISHE